MRLPAPRRFWQLLASSIPQSECRCSNPSPFSAKNLGWPNLVAWSPGSLLSAEVKTTNELSEAQKKWIAQHEGEHEIELLRVVEDPPKGQLPIF